MTVDFIYSCMVTASQILLIGWTGVLVAASIVTFREAPVRVTRTTRQQR
jgi:TM2 domain-containing membrane protein YozV